MTVLYHGIGDGSGDGGVAVSDGGVGVGDSGIGAAGIGDDGVGNAGAGVGNDETITVCENSSRLKEFPTLSGTFRKGSITKLPMSCAGTSKV